MNLDTIAADERGYIHLHQDGERLHLTVTAVAETPFMRLFETVPVGETPSEIERVIVQTRGSPEGEWGHPMLHYRSDVSLTGGRPAMLDFPQ